MCMMAMATVFLGRIPMYETLSRNPSFTSTTIEEFQPSTALRSATAEQCQSRCVYNIVQSHDFSHLTKTED